MNLNQFNRPQSKNTLRKNLFHTLLNTLLIVLSLFAIMYDSGPTVEVHKVWPYEECVEVFIDGKPVGCDNIPEKYSVIWVSKPGANND